MKILAIETSCDETAASLTEDRKVITNIVFSQVNIHKKYGGVYPALARREHKKKINLVIKKALGSHSWKEIDALAVTFGPGLVIALEVGLQKAKELAKRYQKPLIPVNHLEGHIFASFAQSKQGNPQVSPSFPFLAFIASGGHTSLILVKDFCSYQVLGETLDDAVGEALDKAAKILGLSYPGGPVIETLAKTGNPSFLDLPVPMKKREDLNFSFSGLKTAFRKKVEKLSQKEINKNLSSLAASFQKAAFSSLLDKLEKAILQTKVQSLVIGGGVFNNQTLRRLVCQLARKRKVDLFVPYRKKLYGDNAAMIGVAGFFKYQKGVFLLPSQLEKLDRVARPSLKLWTSPLNTPPPPKRAPAS